MDDFEDQFSDVVLFELPTFEDTQAFRARFRSRWGGWSHEDDEVWLFAAELAGTGHELSELLREAQGLLSDRSIPSIRFVLDGRVYALESAEPVYERAAPREPSGLEAS
jgi:hypothetical protein